MPPARTTFGFNRTECACAECALNCRFIPGYLIPTDLAAIAKHLGYENVVTFALENLLASPGATVMTNDEIFQIPTLVPTRQANGACKFLTVDNRCAIHAVSPYGCSHFDVHQSKAEADSRSIEGLKAIAREWNKEEVYALIWITLHAKKLDALSAFEARKKFPTYKPKDCPL